MAYGDPRKYCEIYEVNSDHNGREIERSIARWLSPDADPSIHDLERRAQDLGRSLCKQLRFRIYEQ